MEERDYLLTNQEILGGLRAAIARGESLKDAMMTFYQAGYDKTEIEEAAKAYIEIQNPSEQPTSSTSSKTEKAKEVEKKEDAKKGDFSDKKIAPIKALPTGGNSGNAKILPNAPQKISSYESPKSAKPPGGKAITFVLILVLLLLVGILASVVLFKDEMIVFFNSLFG